MDFPNRLVVAASGNVNGVGGDTLPGSLYPGSGVAGFVPAKAADGVFTITLPGAGLNEKECVVIVTVIDEANGVLPKLTRSPAVEHTSDTVKTVRFLDEAGVAADRNFAVTVIRNHKRS